VDLAFAAFFRRCAAGEKPGYPRYRSRLRYNSLTFKQYGNSFSLSEDGKLVLSKLGHVKLVMHRPLRGTPKTAIVKRTPTGKWFVSLACEDVEPDVRPASNEQVGIDVGLKTFAYLSDGSHLENPRIFRAEEQALAKAQRKLSKAKGKTPEKRKRRKVVARIHERISNRRQNFIAQQVALLVKRSGLIAVEALVVRNMVKNPKLAKSIADAAWSAFFTQLVLKVEEAARQVVKVNPAYTSQTCSACGTIQDMPLSVRVYECGTCALMLDRDHNASRNILQQAVGRHGRVTPEALGSEPWESSFHP
jgi:putative transposase